MGFVFDAVALIDYAKVSMDTLGMVSRTLGQIKVPMPVLREAKQMAASDCGRLGIVIVEPELAELLAASSTPGPLSVQDWLCLGLAQRESLTCVTADRRLRRECIDRGVATIWTLTPLEKLVAVGSMERAGAIDIARGFQRINPTITQEIVDRFEAKLCA
jgi:hypothetical protein